jgi:hypothetical protein
VLHRAFGFIICIDFNICLNRDALLYPDRPM